MKTIAVTAACLGALASGVNAQSSSPLTSAAGSSVGLAFMSLGLGYLTELDSEYSNITLSGEFEKVMGPFIGYAALDHRIFRNSYSTDSYGNVAFGLAYQISSQSNIGIDAFTYYYDGDGFDEFNYDVYYDRQFGGSSSSAQFGFALIGSIYDGELEYVQLLGEAEVASNSSVMFRLAKEIDYNEHSYGVVSKTDIADFDLTIGVEGYSGDTDDLQYGIKVGYDISPELNVFGLYNSSTHMYASDRFGIGGSFELSSGIKAEALFRRTDYPGGGGYETFEVALTFETGTREIYAHQLQNDYYGSFGIGNRLGLSSK